MSTDSTPFLPTPFLPPEIIPLIVEASLDPYDNSYYSTYYYSKSDSKLRYSILKPYNLVNSTWRAFSEPKLLEWVSINTDESAKKWLEFAEQRGGTVEEVKEMSIEFRYESGGDPSKLLKSTPQLIRLSLKSAIVDASDLAGLQHLRRLSLDNTGIAGPPASSTLCMPQLEQMSIYQGGLMDSPSYFLTPAFLPRLRYLHHVDFWITQFRRIVPQLELFDAEWYDGAYPLLAQSNSLLLLPLSQHRIDRLAMLSHLPRIPPFLFLDSDSMKHIQHWTSQHIEEALEDVLACKTPGLRVLFLHDFGPDAAVDSVIKRLVERAVRVVRVSEDPSYETATFKMREIMAEEKRAAAVAE